VVAWFAHGAQSFLEIRDRTSPMGLPIGPTAWRAVVLASPLAPCGAHQEMISVDTMQKRCRAIPEMRPPIRTDLPSQEASRAPSRSRSGANLSSKVPEVWHQATRDLLRRPQRSVIQPNQRTAETLKMSLRRRQRPLLHGRFRRRACIKPAARRKRKISSEGAAGLRPKAVSRLLPCSSRMTTHGLIRPESQGQSEFLLRCGT